MLRRREGEEELGLLPGLQIVPDLHAVGVVLDLIEDLKIIDSGVVIPVSVRVDLLLAVLEAVRETEQVQEGGVGKARGAGLPVDPTVGALDHGPTQDVLLGVAFPARGAGPVDQGGEPIQVPQLRRVRHGGGGNGGAVEILDLPGQTAAEALVRTGGDHVGQNPVRDGAVDGGQQALGGVVVQELRILKIEEVQLSVQKREVQGFQVGEGAGIDPPAGPGPVKGRDILGAAVVLPEIAQGQALALGAAGVHVEHAVRLHRQEAPVGAGQQPLQNGDGAVHPQGPQVAKLLAAQAVGLVELGARDQPGLVPVPAGLEGVVGEGEGLRRQAQLFRVRVNRAEPVSGGAAVAPARKQGIHLSPGPEDAGHVVAHAAGLGQLDLPPVDPEPEVVDDVQGPFLPGQLAEDQRFPHPDPGLAVPEDPGSLGL